MSYEAHDKLKDKDYYRALLDHDGGMSIDQLRAKYSKSEKEMNGWKKNQWSKIRKGTHSIQIGPQKKDTKKVAVSERYLDSLHDKIEKLLDEIKTLKTENKELKKTSDVGIMDLKTYIDQRKEKSKKQQAS